MTSSPAPASSPLASPASTPSMREPAPSIVAEGERRLHRRARLERPVLVETESRSGNARAIDVGANGIALRTELPLREGERVSVYFELPIGYAVETMAQVVRRDGDLVGLRFVDPPREAVIAVRGFCRISGVMPAPTRSLTPNS
jgi:hypothetical protein